MQEEVRIAFAGPAMEAPPAVAEPMAQLAMDAPATVTPTQQVVKKSNEVIRTRDTRGRVIGIKRMAVLERARFFEMIGPESSKNDAFLSIAVPAHMSVEVDGNFLGRPNNRRELDVRISMLDDDGFEAISEAILEHFGPDSESTGEQLKNAPATPN